MERSALPWEKSFDTTVAIRRAMEVFWAKGYVDTSLADLITATGINKGSLYNAFGSKRGLFIKALLLYEQEHRRAALARLDALDDPKEAISSLFAGLKTKRRGRNSAEGCFLANTSQEFPHHDREVQAIVTAGLAEIESFFARQIAVGQSRSVFLSSIDTAATAKALTALLVGMRILARGARDQKTLKATAAQAVEMLSP